MRRIRKIVKSARGIWEPEMNEEDVVIQIRAMLELNGARVHRIVERIPWGKTTSTPGMPDLVGWWPASHVHCIRRASLPIHFFIEVKRFGGKLRPAQVAWLNQAQADRVIAFKAESWKECMAEFEKNGIVLEVG